MLQLEHDRYHPATVTRVLSMKRTKPLLETIKKVQEHVNAFLV